MVYKFLQIEKISDDFVDYLRRNKWSYRRIQEVKDHIIYISGNAQNNIDFVTKFDYVEGTISVNSELPFRMNKDKLLDGAIAINIINCKIVNGSFNYNIYTGQITFRNTFFWVGVIYDDEMFAYLLRSLVSAIKKFHNNLLMISDGLLDVEDLQKLLD